MDDPRFSEQVARLVTQLLPGVIDSERPPIEVTSVAATIPTDGSGLLTLAVKYRVAGRDLEMPWTVGEWEPFQDVSPEAQAEGLATLVRVELREWAGTTPPDRRWW